MELIIDNREKKIINQITKFKFSLKNLELGDYVYNLNNNPYIIIERKTVQDLAASIKDGRYREQKIRLLEEQQKGVKIIYLIEGNVHLKTSGIPSSTFFSVIINGMIRDNIYTYISKNIEESVKFIEKIYQQLEKTKNEINSKNTEKLHEKLHENIENIDIEYASCIKSNKKENLTHHVCYINQLSQIPGISTKIASSIVNKYPTMLKLINKLEIDEGDLLEDHKIGNRRIGKILSQRIFEYLCS
jgi:crossover junction endonuclease MUS81